MSEYRKGAHTVYDIKYHVVWTTKYRYQILRGELGVRCRDLIREVCLQNEIMILKGHMKPDHVHLFVSVPPRLSVSKMMQYIKGKSSRKLQQVYPTLKKRYWGQHMWSRGYFCASSGSVTDEQILHYIEQQSGPPADTFGISE